MAARRSALVPVAGATLLATISLFAGTGGGVDFATAGVGAAGAGMEAGFAAVVSANISVSFLPVARTGSATVPARAVSAGFAGAETVVDVNGLMGSVEGSEAKMDNARRHSGSVICRLSYGQRKLFQRGI